MPQDFASRGLRVPGPAEPSLQVQGSFPTRRHGSWSVTGRGRGVENPGLRNEMGKKAIRRALLANNPRGEIR